MQGRAELHPARPVFGEFHENGNIVTCYYKDLRAALMSSDTAFHYPDANGAYTVLETGIIGYTQYKNCLVVREGRYLLYVSPQLTLYQIDVENDMQPVELAQGAEKFAVSKDGRTYYYTTAGETENDSYLYRCDAKTGSQKKVETHRVLDMYCTEGGNLFFRVVEDGQQNLYTLTSGGEVERILENVKTFYQEENGMIWAIVDEDHYIVYNGKMIQLEVTTME